jgi:hypothetical protein
MNPQLKIADVEPEITVLAPPPPSTKAERISTVRRLLHGSKGSTTRSVKPGPTWSNQDFSTSLRNLDREGRVYEDRSVSYCVLREGFCKSQNSHIVHCPRSTQHASRITPHYDQIRNPKSKTRNNAASPKKQRGQTGSAPGLPISSISHFEFVSDFDIRISDFNLSRLTLPAPRSPLPAPHPPGAPPQNPRLTNWK